MTDPDNLLSEDQYLLGVYPEDLAKKSPDGRKAWRVNLETAVIVANQYCEVFQAVTSSFFANTYRPRALFLANTSGRGPTKITAGRQLGLVQIRIALQEVCYVIDG